MGNQTIADRADDTVTDESWYDVLRQVLSGDLYPRRASDAAPTNEGASLGSSTKRWRRANVASGDFSVGTIKWRLSYNGLLLPSEGWMQMDGRQVTEAEYDDEHGDGAWAEHIVASPLEGKYLPDMTNRYLVGAASVGQDGSVAITPVGNAGSTVNLSHSHKWILSKATNANDQSYNAAGTAIDVSSSSMKNANKVVLFLTNNQKYQSVDMYTDKQLGTAVDIRPVSLEVLYFMRII